MFSRRPDTRCSASRADGQNQGETEPGNLQRRHYRRSGYARRREATRRRNSRVWKRERERQREEEEKLKQHKPSPLDYLEAPGPLENGSETSHAVQKHCFCRHSQLLPRSRLRPQGQITKLLISSERSTHHLQISPAPAINLQQYLILYIHTITASLPGEGTSSNH